MLQRTWGMHLPRGAMACPWVGREERREAAGCGSVFAGQQQRGDAAIPFSDDPELQVARDLLGREQPIFAGLQCGIVLPPVVVTEISPVTIEMALEIRRGVEYPPLNQVIHACGHDHMSSPKT